MMMSSKGNNYLMVDEKKMKRMISNRESARRSRMKKVQHMKDLNDQIFYLTIKRDEMLLKIQGFSKGYAGMETENMVLRSQKQELEKRLKYAKNIVVCGSWYESDVQEPWVSRPWEQLQQQASNNSMMPVMSSAGCSKF